MAEAIVEPPLFVVHQDLVGFRELLEFLLGLLGVVLVQVRMELLG